MATPLPETSRRLSSKWTFFNKRVFPVIWFGFVAVFFMISLIAAMKGEKIGAVFFAAPLVMAAFGYGIMKMLVLDLVDEVFDLGDALLVKNGGQEDRILLSNISNVSHSSFTNPSRITLTLRHSSRFGKEVTFSPLLRLNPFAKDPTAAELIERIELIRQK
jgi:hypothetical protein